MPLRLEARPCRIDELRMKKITSLLAFAFLLFGAVRAVANHRQLLKSIDLNGLLGHVRILPYMDVSLTLAER